MRCEEAQALMDRYVIEGLPSDEREAFAEHLRGCHDCQQQLENLQRLLTVLRSDPTPPVPHGFVGRVMARAEQQGPAVVHSKHARGNATRAVWKAIQFSAGIAAALAAGLLAGVFLGNEAWRTDGPREVAAANRSADPLSASGLEQLVDPGEDSLAQAFFALITTSNR